MRTYRLMGPKANLSHEENRGSPPRAWWPATCPSKALALGGSTVMNDTVQLLRRGHTRRPVRTLRALRHRARPHAGPAQAATTKHYRHSKPPPLTHRGIVLVHHPNSETHRTTGLAHPDPAEPAMVTRPAWRPDRVPVVPPLRLSHEE
jgi:hypothetical protein